MVRTKPKRLCQPSELERQTGHAARLTADKEAVRIPWQCLKEAREKCVEWEAFVLWVRAIEYSEGDFPLWLAKLVAKRCPGFLKFAEKQKQDHLDAQAFFWHRLERWINERNFSKARREGWMNAVGYYAARDLTSLRNHAYWEYCEREWKRSKPVAYPSFREWLKASEQCTDRVLDESEMVEGKRQLIKLMRRVGVRRLSQAVERYLEWEAFAYWTRTALEAGSRLPASVAREMKKICPGFLEADAAARAATPGEERHCRFNRLIRWIENHEFADAQKHGWFDVLHCQARLHPRHARIIDFWHDWEAGRAKHPVARYPSLRQWCDAVDRYTFERDDG